MSSLPFQVCLVSQLCLDELAVQAGDVGDGLVLRADSLAGASVSAVTETEFFHAHDHCLGALGGLRTSLGQQGKLRHLRRYEEHGRAVLTSCYAGTATNACCAVHSLVGVLLRDEDGIGILSLSGTDAGITAGLDDLVEGTTVDHAVLDDGECSRTPGLNSDDVAIVEAAHVELTGGSTTLGLSVRCAVDVERAHTADTLAAVVVEYERLLTLVDELFVEDVKHLEE